MYKSSFLIPAILALLTSPLTGDESISPVGLIDLRFQHREGEVQHAEAVVEESVFINGRYSHDAQIGESSVSVTRKVDSDGTAILDATFRTEERITGWPGYYEWVSSETVSLSRDNLGRMDVPADAARPVLRDIPVFPETGLKPGDTWTAPAEEVHIFRFDGLNAGPYRAEIPVAYQYIGDSRENGIRLARIQISYNIYVPVSSSGEPVRLISGRSDQELLWNIEQGRPVSKREEFEFIIMMSDGTIQEFRGRQTVYYRNTILLDRDRETEIIRRDLEDIPGIDVESADQGVLLTVDADQQILFTPESSAVSPDQRYRLEALRAVLEAYGERDILITGHTAHFGSAEGRQKLSGERAAAVAEILFPEGRSGPGRLYLRGAGSEEPEAVEDGAAGSARNRRVEILILD